MLEVWGVVNFGMKGRFSMHAVCTSVAAYAWLNILMAYLALRTMMVLRGLRQKLDLLMELVLELLLGQLCIAAILVGLVM